MCNEEGASLPSPSSFLSDPGRLLVSYLLSTTFPCTQASNSSGGELLTKIFIFIILHNIGEDRKGSQKENDDKNGIGFRGIGGVEVMAKMNAVFLLCVTMYRESSQAQYTHVS